MRRMSLPAVLAIAVTMLSPASGRAAQGEEELQVEAGTIKMLTRFVSTEDTVSQADGAWPGLHRRLWLAASESNGLIGYTLSVAPETWGGRFEVEINSQAQVPGDADLGVFLYENFGDIATQSTLPVTTAEYDVRAPGGEKGFIPPGSRYAVVFMSRGADVSFTYRGYTPMSSEITEFGYAPDEITVGLGGYVYWTNVDEDFHSVTAVNGAFDSSPSLKHPMRPGDVFGVRFLELGDYAFRDRFGDATGVVHVVPGPGPGTPAGS